MPPGGRRTMRQRLEKFLPFDRVIDLGKFLRQVKIIHEPWRAVTKEIPVGLLVPLLG
jgi:hypothetical protein